MIFHIITLLTTLGVATFSFCVYRNSIRPPSHDKNKSDDTLAIERETECQSDLKTATDEQKQ